jgi:pyruvate dehydrogenase E2 component (dihydrolipoamide acetyltransferase)
MLKDITLPVLGENVERADVLAVLVAAGDTVTRDQPLLEVETDKATVEVPAPFAGVVREVRVRAGEEVAVGQSIATLEVDGAAASDDQARPEAAASSPRPRRAGGGAAAGPAPARSESGTSSGEDGRARREGDGAVASANRVAGDPDGGGADEDDHPVAPAVVGAGAGDFGAASAGTIGAVAAAPSVRRLARELGIDVDAVRGTGPEARVSIDDVKRHARGIIADAGRHGGRPESTPALPDFSQWGAVERERMGGVRRTTALTMSRAWVTIPHVTQFDRADVTEVEAVRRRLAPRAEAAGAKLTVTAIVLKVAAAALRVFPKFNASLDVDNEEIVYKKYVHIGVAVDTPHGLIVPVVRDADRKSLVGIARELADLSTKARARKVGREDLAGASFTITNLGGLGTTYFSPLVNWPEVAVLGLGRAGPEAVHRDGAFVPRLMLPLSVSFDHRLIDGADAARFLRWIAEALEQPLLLVLEG